MSDLPPTQAMEPLVSPRAAGIGREFRHLPITEATMRARLVYIASLLNGLDLDALHRSLGLADLELKKFGRAASSLIEPAEAVMEEARFNAAGRLESARVN